MKKPFWSKRFPTLFGLFLISAGVFLTAYLSNQQQIFTPQAGEQLTIDDLRISNQTGTSLSISFTTKSAASAQVKFGKTLSDASIYFDDRDQIGKQAREYKTHHFTIDQLTVGQSYVFSILIKGNTLDNGGIGFPTKTAVTSQQSQQNQSISGLVQMQDGIVLSDGIVYAQIANATLLSTYTKSDGSYLLPLTTIYSDDLTGVYIPKNNDIITLEAVSGDGQKGTKTVLFGDHTAVAPLIIGSIDSSIPTQQESPMSSGFTTDGFIDTPVRVATVKTPGLVSPKEGEAFIDQRPLIRGTGEPNQRVEIIIEAVQQGEATVDANGSWQYQPQQVLEAGLYTLSVKFFTEQEQVQSFTRQFQVLASGTQIAENATPSASPTDASTPTVIQSAQLPTQATIPDTGVSLPVIGLGAVGIGITLLGFFVLFL